MGIVEKSCGNNPVLNVQPVNSSYPNQGSPKAIVIKKKNIWIILIIVVIAIIIVTSFIVFISNGFKNISSGTEQQQIVIDQLKASYPAGWIRDQIEEKDTVVIKKGGSHLAYNLIKSDTYYSSSSFMSNYISELKGSYKSLNQEGEVKDVKINGSEWKKVEFTATINGTRIKGMLLCSSTDYEIYSIIYMATEKEYGINVNEVNQIVESTTIPVKQANTKEVKDRIIGEWDCGITGYLIVNDDNTYYFYRDSSKNKDNVGIGTYEVYDKIVTAANGYSDGVTFIGSIKKAMIDGEEQEVLTNKKIEYVFVTSKPNEYEAKNISTGSVFRMKKIK